MKLAGSSSRIALKNIVYLTDFGPPSQAALPFAVTIAREFGAKIHALHVLLPEPYLYSSPASEVVAARAQTEYAETEMKRVDELLAEVAHEVTVARGFGVWDALQHAVADCDADLLVLGTHGRTGAERLLMGSIAEEIFRRSSIPVLTIGLAVRSDPNSVARFGKVLFATDFTPAATAAAPYAISLAQEHEARLILLHVVRDRAQAPGKEIIEATAAHVMYELREIVPESAELWCRPEAVIEYGDPATRILAAAKERGADVIVLGVRNAKGRLGAATHLERDVAHKVVAHATCPVLTVQEG